MAQQDELRVLWPQDLQVFPSVFSQERYRYVGDFVVVRSPRINIIPYKDLTAFRSRDPRFVEHRLRPSISPYATLERAGGVSAVVVIEARVSTYSVSRHYRSGDATG